MKFIQTQFYVYMFSVVLGRGHTNDNILFTIVLL